MNNLLAKKIINETADKKMSVIFDYILFEKPKKSDVIVWLQGDQYDRGGKVLELFKNGFAPMILISGNNIRIGKKNEKSAFYDIRLEDMKNFLIKNGVDDECVLIDGQSLNTAQHPKNVIEIAQEKKWKQIILVSSPYHQLRAFLSFVKYLAENKINVQIINQPAIDLSWDGVAGGKTKTRKELFAEELIKIKQYKNDVADYKQGLDYINRQNEVVLRPANMDDAKKILEWRNDLFVRNNSFNKELIPFDQHLLWLKKTLNDVNRHLFVILNKEGEEIGQVRFDVEGDEAEISIVLNKDFRGKGYGVQSIKYSSEKFLNENKVVKRIISRIISGNDVAIKIFKKAGFLETDDKDSIIRMKFEL